MARLSSVVFIVLLGCRSLALAQERRPYIGASLMISTQGSHRPGSSPSFPTTGVGGTAPGTTLECGGFLAHRLSIAFEASVPARIESIQETDYFITFRTENKHRDLIASGLFHVHLPRAGRVGVAIAGGPSIVREDTRQRMAFTLGPPLGVGGAFGPFGPETSLTRWTIAITGGADADIGIGPHVSVVPQVRLHRVERAASGEGDSGFLGLSSWIWRPAVGVRGTF